jgi:hypothetical protein
VRTQNFIQRVEDFADAQFGDAFDRGVEILPEIREQRLPLQLAVETRSS